MANAREIQSRMKSIRDTMKITNAMYMISSTKLRRAKKELEDTEPYFYMLRSMMSRTLRHMPDLDNRYFVKEGERSTREKRCYLVVTADKGLAGAYNHNVLKIAEEHFMRDTYRHLLVVGELGRQYFASRKIPVDQHFLYTAQHPTIGRARIIATEILEMYDSGEVDEVYMIFTSMKNGMQTEANFERLLPLTRGRFNPAGLSANVYQEEFRFNPSPNEVINSMVPSYLSGYIYGALVESYCSEHNARMTAMQAANDSAQEMIHDLSIEYNRVRQAMNTQEITEVVSGARAQKKKKGVH